jgi:uncharacterized coiled-coil protein SlyX
VFAAEVLVHAIEKVTEKLYEFAREAITEAIHKAIEQENAIATLNNALAASGTFTVELSRSLQEFGEKIQKTTEFTQEQALQSQALFISLNNLTEAGIKRADEGGARSRRRPSDRPAHGNASGLTSDRRNGR